jgi:hypothetical protein
MSENSGVAVHFLVLTRGEELGSPFQHLQRIKLIPRADLFLRK